MWGVYPHKQNVCMKGVGRGDAEGEGGCPYCGTNDGFFFWPCLPRTRGHRLFNPSPWIFFQPLFSFDFHRPEVHPKVIQH
jgi:hypothetical protein